jgi:hypothetical protein
MRFATGPDLKFSIREIRAAEKILETTEESGRCPLLESDFR